MSEQYSLGDRFRQMEQDVADLKRRIKGLEWLASGKTELDQLRALALSGLQTDGAHHKQWYLYKIAELLECDVSNLNEGIAP